MIQYLLVLFAFTLLIKYIVSKIIISKKANLFLNKHFQDEDKLYTIEEVSNSFKLDKEHFKSLISILETHQYFSFFNKSKIQLINKSMNGIGKMLPKKLIINPTKGFICKSTMAVNIPSLHSKIGQTEIINTTSQSGIPCAVKNSCKFLQNSCTIYQFSFLSVVVFCFLSAFDCDSLFLF